MTINADDIRKIANLARLELSDEQSLSLAGECQKILTYVEKLQELDVSQVEAMSHVHGIENVFREDEKSQHVVSSEAILAAIPETHERYIKVPIIIEQE